MTLWWIGNALLLLVILPVVVLLLRGVLGAARGIVPSVNRIAAAATVAILSTLGTMLLAAVSTPVSR